jgi:hypothetical protein
MGFASLYPSYALYQRHCERSEAIHSDKSEKNGLLRRQCSSQRRLSKLFRHSGKDQTSDVQPHIGEFRGSGFARSASAPE